MRLVVTKSGNSATQGPHQVAQTLMSNRFSVSFLTSLVNVASSSSSKLTGSLFHFSMAACASDCLTDHLVEQPNVRVFSTETFLPARIASRALRVSWLVTVLTSELSMRPTYRNF